MSDFEKYLISIGVQNECAYSYEREELYKHREYFKKCMNNGLSAYKALLFLHDYINNNYTLDDI
jgi:hypothetical protein